MDGVYFMDAEITPARSLSKRGLIIVMGITVALGAIPVITFMAMGAHLVLPFVGIDVLGLWLAFYIMNRKVNAERVRVSSDLVEVMKNNKPVWSSPTAFTRVEEDEHAVRLAIHGRRLSVAQALSPGERDEFAGALAEAIRKARGARYPGG